MISKGGFVKKSPELRKTCKRAHRLSKSDHDDCLIKQGLSNKQKKEGGGKHER